MKILIRTAQAGSGSYTAIADDSAGDIVDYRPPKMSTEQYVVAGYGATGKTVIDLGNQLWTCTIYVRKFYSTQILARQAIASLGAAVAVGLLDVQIYDSAGSDATYLPKCSCNAFTPDPQDGHRGVAVYYTLQFIGPSYTTTAP